MASAFGFVIARIRVEIVSGKFSVPVMALFQLPFGSVLPFGSLR
tara:strand:- start:720 stop:851 length:132 start_codon:yes stop_codon:yes gene_type:complete